VNFFYLLVCAFFLFLPDEVPASKKSPVEKISADEYNIGLVHLDAKKRQIDFPATVNMREGAIEYFVVHKYGKVHESIFKTEAEPLHIHLAALLLYAPGPVNPNEAASKNQNSSNSNSGPILKPNTNIVEKGASIEVTVRFFEGEPRIVRAEALILDSAKSRTMREGPWMYNGSRVVEGTFVAQRDGSIVSVIADPDSLADNPGPRRDDDDNWQALTANLPPLGTKATIQMRLLNKEEQKELK
jgi:hypothetical protein